ncbi:MAG: hypothetical protein FD165_1508 [Gammaproteobacteria bacterium]|nr:MAG: hypothetical protein FD165_1508 [Gammaproteobacteria bacterium]TND02481.1 MAG: hypothetical protein FD120_2222 [Gammaproteobacteria bacterium]
MRKHLLFLAAITVAQPAWSISVDEAIAHYNPQGTLALNPKHGDELWHQKNIGEDGKERDCMACHGKDLTKPGKHVKTGKVIDPLAPSANKERLTDLEKIEKWFTRNCKWTYGRECTDQEKVDLLKYLSAL